MLWFVVHIHQRAAFIMANEALPVCSSFRLCMLLLARPRLLCLHTNASYYQCVPFCKTRTQRLSQQNQILLPFHQPTQLLELVTISLDLIAWLKRIFWKIYSHHIPLSYRKFSLFSTEREYLSFSPVIVAFDVITFWPYMDFHEIWYVCSIYTLEQS